MEYWREQNDLGFQFQVSDWMTISITQVHEEKKEYNRIFDDVKPLLEMVFCSTYIIHLRKNQDTELF